MKRRSTLLVVALVAVVVGGTAVYVLVAPKRYEARAELLVTPAQLNPALRGLGLLEDTNDTPAAVTAARLVESRGVARTVGVRLRMTEGEALDSVDARRAGESNVVAVVGRASSPERAAQIANGFADETVAQRSARFQTELRVQIGRIRELLSGMPRGSPRAIELDRRLTQLQRLEGTPDPTLRVLSDAVVPSEPAWPRPWASLLVALGVSLVLGLALAWLLQRRRAAAERVAAPLPVYPPDLEQLDRRITARERELEERLAGLEEHPGERELEQRLTQLEGHPPEPRARELERRLARLEGRPSEPRARELERRLAGLEERLEELTSRAPLAASVPPEPEPPAPEPEPAAVAPEPEPTTVEPPLPLEPAPAPGPEPPPAAAEAGAYRLDRLESLVAAQEDEQPERVEEWRAYLFSLRAYTRPDGTLPPSFDYLIEEVFDELLR